MPKRPEGVPEILPIDKNLIQNGDTFDIMRLDGLDPMIAFAMGAATGHTAIALWKENEVHIQRGLSIRAQKKALRKPFPFALVGSPPHVLQQSSKKPAQKGPGGLPDSVRVLLSVPSLTVYTV